MLDACLWGELWGSPCNTFSDTNRLRLQIRYLWTAEVLGVKYATVRMCRVDLLPKLARFCGAGNQERRLDSRR